MRAIALLSLSLSASLSLAAASACRQPPPPAQTSSTQAAPAQAGRVPPSPPPAPAVPPLTPFPRTLKDALGNALTIPAPPRRIVSQTLGTDEILFDICPHDRIVGVSTTAVEPAYSYVVDEVRKLKLPAITTVEIAVKLKPDLVFVASYSQAELIDILRSTGAPVFRFANFDRIDDVKTNVRIVGRATGEDAAADALVADMDRRLAAVAARVPAGPRPHVMTYATDGYTAGANTLFDDVIRAAGGTNASAEHGADGFLRISAEQLLKWDPDWIVTGAKPGEERRARDRMLANPVVAATRAARLGHVIAMDTRQFLTVSHHVVDAVETLATALQAPASASGNTAGH